ncbi:uncharacterized protein [Diabrotica undecimpunctata]|uniref:uncharacterized protein n=1 Tax=Diabrotica undecimpunctata TaxID=50387 RepID=UPI003B63B095
MGLTVLNDGKAPTFVRGNSESFLDITLVSTTFLNRVVSWTVLEEESFSLHKYVSFEIASKRQKRKNGNINLKRCLNDDVFVDAFGLIGPGRENVREFIEGLSDAQELACVRLNGRYETKKTYWRNEQLENLRINCMRVRRECKRLRREQAGDLKERINELKRMQNEYRNEIRRSKKERWSNLLQDLERDIWGQDFKIVCTELKGKKTPYPLPKEKKLRLIRKLFLQVENRRKRVIGCLEAKLGKAVRRMKIRKVPGIDEVMPEIVRLAALGYLQVFLRLLNKLLEQQQFPTMLKEAKVVLIPEGRGEEEEVQFRPICLLSSIAKL